MTHDEHIETMRDNYDDHGAELAAKDAEIERLRAALVADDEGSTAYQSGWHARDAEIERLRREHEKAWADAQLKAAEIEQLRYDLGLEQHSNARLRGEHQEYVATAMALQNAVAEIERLRKLKEHPYPRERTWSDCEAELQQLRDELAREKQEHDRCTTFHAIAVKERNYERVLALKRDAEIERLRKELAEKDDYIRTVSRPIGAHSYE